MCMVCLMYGIEFVVVCMLGGVIFTRTQHHISSCRHHSCRHMVAILSLSHTVNVKSVYRSTFV